MPALQEHGDGRSNFTLGEGHDERIRLVRGRNVAFGEVFLALNLHFTAPIVVAPRRRQLVDQGVQMIALGGNADQIALVELHAASDGIEGVSESSCDFPPSLSLEVEVEVFVERALRVFRIDPPLRVHLAASGVELVVGERQQLDAANASADALEDRLLADNAFREIQDERLATEKLLSGLTADLLSLQSGAARTAKERQRIELDLLEITQRQRREALQLELDRNPALSAGQRADAMAANGRIEAGERSAVIRNNLSPLDAWRDESLKTADEIAEAYENVAARGLDALNDGLVDAIMNSKSLGETFSSVAKQILADLLSISVRRGITEPLADLLFGGSGSSGGGGGIGASIFSAIKSTFRIPGFSSGVTNFGGGLAYVHAGEILANLPQGTDVIPAHAVQAMGSKTGVAQVVHVEPSKYFDVRVSEVAAPQSAAAFSTARQTVPSDIAKTNRYTRGRR